MDCSVNLYIYLDHIITFAPILTDLIVSYCIIIFVGVTDVTGCYWVTPHRQMANMLPSVKYV